MVTKKFKNVFYSTIIDNKKLIWSSVLITILAYGFTITNFSIGIDDFAAFHYLHTDGWGNMIQQGRLAHVLFEQILGIIRFVPFLNDCIGAILFWFSAMLFCALFQYVTKGKLSTNCLIVFSGIYISFSIINEKYIYNLDVIVTMFSYVAVAYALLCTYEFVHNRKRRYCFAAIAAMMMGIASYESFVFVYLCGMYAIFLLETIIGEKRMNGKKVVLTSLYYMFVLVSAIIIYYIIVAIVQVAAGQMGVFERDAIWFNGNGIIENLTQVIVNLAYGITRFSYLPILEFAVFSLIGFLFACYYTWKRRSLVIIWIFLFLFLSNFGIHIILGVFTYRAAQSLCLFVGVSAIMAVTFLEANKVTKKLVYLSAVFVIVQQLFDLNQWFYIDYARYKKEVFAIHSIATRLVTECDVSKPVVFTNRPSDGYLQVMNSDNQVNGLSLVYRGIAAFGDIQSPDMIRLFEMHGYDFLKQPTLEQAQDAIEKSKEMEGWPKRESVKEFDEFIIVNFSDPVVVHPEGENVRVMDEPLNKIEDVLVRDHCKSNQ